MGCALAMKIVEVFFEGNLRASTMAVLSFSLCLVTGNVWDDGHSLCLGPGVRCGADPQPTAVEEGKKLELELNLVLGVLDYLASPNHCFLCFGGKSWAISDFFLLPNS